MGNFQDTKITEVNVLGIQDFLPALTGAVVTVLLHIKLGWRYASINGLISFAVAFYLVPAILVLLRLRFPSIAHIVSEPNIISAAGFIGGVAGGKALKICIFVLDNYAGNFLVDFFNRMFGRDK